MVPVFRQRATMKSIATLRQPSPYLTLLRKLIDEASGMYFAGQVISPMGRPNQIICASIWLSKTKSSEFFSRGRSFK